MEVVGSFLDNRIAVLLHFAVFGPCKVLETGELFLAYKRQHNFSVSGLTQVDQN